MKKTAFIAMLAVLLTIGMVSAEPQGQYNPVNRYVTASGTDTASTTINAVGTTRVRIYSIWAICYTSNSTITPSIRVTDGSTLVFALPHSVYGDITYPIHERKFNPPLTLTAGNAVTVSANFGAGCGGGTDLIVQADQF